ncbi:MAG: hypothetical protein KDA87_16910 [Planctomycetales bacterium]|nr:hypothetical protein [Planctomycetales bacterium]
MHTVFSRDVSNAEVTEPSRLVIGTLVGISASGVPLVEFPGNHAGPQEAMTAVQLTCEDEARTHVGREVMLHLEAEGDRIVLMSFLHERIVADRQDSTGSQSGSQKSKSLHLEADSELQLTCGKSSLVMKKNGKVLLKGIDIVSHAENRQRIVGGEIKIN